MKFQGIIKFTLGALFLMTATCSMAQKGMAQTETVDKTDAVECKDPRPQICTMDYTPVCGLHKDHSTKTYSNGCGACSNANVISWRKGECPKLNGRALSKDEVLKLFSGNTYEAEIPSRKLTMTVYVDPDGNLRGMQNGHKFTSRWAVNDMGEMCVSYKTKLSCRKVIEQDGVYKKIKTTDTGDAIELVVYHSFTPGNPNNY